MLSADSFFKHASAFSDKKHFMKNMYISFFMIKCQFLLQFTLMYTKIKVQLIVSIGRGHLVLYKIEYYQGLFFT